MKPRRLSGLQMQVLSVYRIMLRAAKEKQDASISRMVRSEFRKNSSIPVTQHHRIEWMLNQSRGKLELMQSPNCTNVTFFGPDN
ncbi:succinate dehydrogenase assembly factor 1, mitochondrial [Acrasis kona]|uniref:Succinate dehydrogenase assembly factor 1, mitochondrial n=1 Tax=Acrasis kona TaxID=1008807 RepID=A0AAW2ZJI5_9EUKA